MADQIRITVRFFASLRQAVGTDHLERQVPEGSTVAGLMAGLADEFPAVPVAAGTVYAAVNKSYAGRDVELREGDEVALFPPVSGGQDGARKRFEITDAPLSLDDAAARVGAPGRGAITVFAGVVRGETVQKAAGADRVLETSYLEYEAYAEMAEPMLAQIGAEVQARWPQVEAVSIVHRVGRLEVGEASVVIAVAAPHRRGTFDACSYAIERLKAIVPIWKKEVGSDGEWWVEGPHDPDAASPVVGGDA